MKNIYFFFKNKIMISKNQQNFLNFFQNEFGITRTAKFLDKLNKIVPWSSIANDIENKREIWKWWVWRPKTETIKMIKILFIQWLYGLSDPEAEDQIRDRNSFQIFLWIKSAKEVPDALWTKWGSTLGVRQLFVDSEEN